MSSNKTFATERKEETKKSTKYLLLLLSFRWLNEIYQDNYAQVHIVTQFFYYSQLVHIIILYWKSTFPSLIHQDAKRSRIAMAAADDRSVAIGVDTICDSITLSSCFMISMISLNDIFRKL